MHTGWQRAARQAGMRTAVPAAFVLPSLLLASCVFVLVRVFARAFVGACAAVRVRTRLCLLMECMRGGGVGE